jgi:cobalt-precorrin 5A hydrolase
MKVAVLVLTAAGLEHAQRIKNAFGPDVAIFGPSCVVGRCGGEPLPEERDAASRVPETFPTAVPGVLGWVGPLRRALPRIWAEHDAIVAVMALGIVVRLVGPLVSDKRKDPAVVVVDDGGTFAISVLGGHGASANELTLAVARVLNAAPVVTTASDAQRLPAVDLIGREFGWVIERAENLTRVAALVVRRAPIAVWQDAGTSAWWRRFGPWPDHFHRMGSWDDLRTLRPSAVLAISDRILPGDLPPDHTVVYRPPTLVAGVGCRRGTPREVIERWADSVFARHELAPASLAAVATATLKLDEPGLLEFARMRGVPVVAIPHARLASQPGVESPSERVRAKVGLAAVAEPAALHAAGATDLLVAKQKGPGVTLALARRPDG